MEDLEERVNKQMRRNQEKSDGSCEDRKLTSPVRQGGFDGER